MIKRVLYAMIAITILSTVFVSPAVAQQQNSFGWLCEKNLENGTQVTQDDPRYAEAEFQPFIYLLQRLVLIILVGAPIAGAGIAVYAAIASLFYTPGGDSDVGKFAKMRRSGIIVGVAVPIALVAADLIVDRVVGTDVTCFIPTPF